MHGSVNNVNIHPNPEGMINFEIMGARNGYMIIAEGETIPSLITSDEDLRAAVTTSAENLMEEIEKIIASEQRAQVVMYAIPQDPNKNLGGADPSDLMNTLFTLLRGKVGPTKPNSENGCKTTLFPSKSNPEKMNNNDNEDGLSSEDLDEVINAVKSGAIVTGQKKKFHN